MDDFISETFESMMDAIERIENDAANILQLSERSYFAAKEALQKVSNYMGKYTFADRVEEIRFFKIIKPKFLQELIYYAEMYHIEAGKPAAGKKALTHYLKEIMTQIRLYFERNQDFYNYWRSGKTNMDHIYFIQQTLYANLPPEYATDPDPSGYSNYYSLKLGKFQAFERLKTYLDTPLKVVEELTEKPYRDNNIYSLNWTDSKSGLIELVYAIQSKGAINNGNIELKQIVEAFENFLHVRLGNYYGVFQQNIRIRKKNRTQYLNQLKERLEMRMDEEDENPKSTI